MSEVPTPAWDMSHLPQSGRDIPGTGKARAILANIQNRRASVRTCLNYIDGVAERHSVRPTDLTRTLEYAEGDVVVLTWDSTGYAVVGYLPVAESFDALSYSGLADERDTGNATVYRRIDKAAAKEMLACGAPSLLARTESDISPVAEVDDSQAPSRRRQGRSHRRMQEGRR